MHGRKSTEWPQCTWAALEYFDTHDKLAATQLVLRCDLERTVPSKPTIRVTLNMCTSIYSSYNLQERVRAPYMLRVGSIIGAYSIDTVDGYDTNAASLIIPYGIEGGG